MNSLWKIKPTPEGTVGFQQSLEERIRVRAKNLIKVFDPNSVIIKDCVLKVKLSGDGTKIDKRLHVVVFTFTLLNDRHKACSWEGNHILAVFKDPEKYDYVKKALMYIITEMKTLNVIRINGVKYQIDYCLGGDWKFLAMATGIDAASSTYACIWCKCPKDLQFDVEKEWPLSDTNEGARTIEDNIKLASLPRSKKQFSMSHDPIFPAIPLTNVGIDNLHLFL